MGIGFLVGGKGKELIGNPELLHFQIHRGGKGGLSGIWEAFVECRGGNKWAIAYLEFSSSQLMYAKQHEN